MTRQCEVCNYTFDISDIYVGRRLRNWPKCMCKLCRQRYPEFENKQYVQSKKMINKIITRMTPLEILLSAGYPKEYALNIIGQGL